MAGKQLHWKYKTDLIDWSDNSQRLSTLGAVAVCLSSKVIILAQLITTTLAIVSHSYNNGSLISDREAISVSLLLGSESQSWGLRFM